MQHLAGDSVNNPQGTVEVPLGLFGGVNYELSPTDLPMGLSPDALNMAFIPSGVFTRPSLKRYLTFNSTAQIVYATSYVKPDGTIVQFVCDSQGRMYADGVQIGKTVPSNRFKTAQMFNKLYIAISDGEHGADVPLQFDGTNLDRVSQDGPGGAPTVADQGLPAVALVTGSMGTAIAVATATPNSPQSVQIGDGGDGVPQYQTYYTQVQYVTSAPHGLNANESVSINGNTQYNYGNISVLSIDSATAFSVSAYNSDNTVGNGGTVSAATSLLVRSNNQVTAYTATPHGLQVGYQASISGVPDASTPIQKAQIDNNNSAGIATVTTAQPHGFVPGNYVTITNVAPANVGDHVTAWNVTDSGTVGQQILQFTTAQPHGLRVGDQVVESTNGGVMRQHPVDTILDANNFTVITTNATGSGTQATLTGAWPLDSGQTVSVVTVPSATTFTIALNGPSLTWTSGSLAFPWNGTFYVTSVPSATSFTYAQTGPDAQVNSGTGTATPIGQIAPGKRNVVCIFQTRTGYTTAPSPTVQFTGSGGEYVLVSNIPIGPANVVARIIAFTGANGGKYFYLPVPPQINGTFVGTSTVVNDNVTTSAVFDFSDRSLLSATAIDIAGNNLFRQVVLGPVLGFHSYSARLFAWGEWNKVNQFLNMGFEGGYYPGQPNQPLGWTLAAPGVMSASGDYGLAWMFSTPGSAGAISQTAYRDRYGVQILQPQTQYTFRAWVSGAATAELYSVTSGVLASASVVGTGQFASAKFSLKTPVVIPADTVFRVWGNLGTIVDELEVVYTDNLYLKYARASYFDNPEAFDGVSGVIGPANDPNQVRTLFERKDVLHFLTYGPNGALYDTNNSASEPSDWQVSHVASKCGAISVWGDAKFEDWQVWASDTGLRMYNGGDVEKMSQEIQPVWDTITPTAKQFSFVANDPYTRRIYVGLPLNGAATVNAMYPLDYRELNTAGQLANGGPYKIGQGGKVFTSDITRKWCPWTMTVNYCALLQTGGASFMAFCCGQGTTLADASYGAVYTLREGTIDGVDDDYGSYISRYTTYYFVSQDEAGQYRLGTHRKLYAFLSAYLTGVGKVQWTPLVDRSGYAWPSSAIATLRQDANRDIEFGLNVQGDRCAFQLNTLIAPQPYPQNGNGMSGFSLNNVVVALKDNPHDPVAGFNG